MNTTAEPDLHRMADVVGCVQLGRAMVHRVDRPEQFVLGPVPPINQEIGHHRDRQELQRISGGPQRREQRPQGHRDEAADAERLPEAADRPRKRRLQRHLHKVHHEAREAGLDGIAFDGADLLDDRANQDGERGDETADSNANELSPRSPLSEREA